MTLGTKPVIFISYAHADEPEKPREGEEKWLSFVRDHLRPAVKHGAMDIWVDTLMRGGDDWNPEIERKLRQCDVFVLLVSRYSTSSDYVVDKEIAIIRDRQKNGEDVRFYPLLLTPTADAGLDVVRDKNMRPRFGRPFSTYSPSDRDQHMAAAANEIAEIAAEIAARKSARPPQSAATPSPPEPVVSSTLMLPPQAILASALPPNPRMIGREDRLEELVNAILEEDRPIVVPGALGMGKTTLALAAAHDPRVVERFGKERRFFVNLEPAPNAEGVLTGLAVQLGLPATGAASEVEAKIAAACAAEPVLAILDNLETPWRKDAAATEALLGELAAIEGLRLVITVRGEPPRLPAPGARTLQDIERLQDADARVLFLLRAGKQFAADPALPGLLAALDGHPLSIELLAANARGKANLSGLAQDWKTRSARLLKSGKGDVRLNSLRASLDISLEALAAHSAPHRLIRLMALLPDGMSQADSHTVLNEGKPDERESEAASVLETARLASRPDGRWRLLAPIRETLLADFPPEIGDLTRLIRLSLALAAKGRNAGRDGWSETRDEVVAEAGNLDAMIGVSLRQASLPEGLSDAVSGLAEFHRLTGLASTAFLPAAARRFRDAGDVLGEANCIKSLGDIALRRSDQDGARQRYEAALPLYQKVGSVLGEATCIRSLGDIALRRFDHEGARQRYEAALPLYQKVGSVLGEANCIKSLGDIALRRFDHEGARERNEAALPLYQKVGQVLGEANCIQSLGDIALARSDHEGARQRYEAALPLYQKVGDVLGEANCIQGLGNIALARSDHQGARQRYEAALPLYQKVGAVVGEANGIQSLGDVDEAKGEIALACERWREALALYTRIPDPNSIGAAHHRLARHAATPEEAAKHREAARTAWASIDRPDLIEKHLGKDA
jgi:tetratricopeptide (TPR) repeat protein